MSEIAIRLAHISKQYHIGKRQASYKTLRDTLSDAFVGPIRRAGKLLRGQATGAAELDDTIWALKDVSFEITRGELVGLIGENGAGKSTLLKLLTGITEPTDGYAEVHGQVGALVQVGAGFHPELTGRENVYLNGAILGMSQSEINRKFDEIVAFSEIDQFIDTPVKHYSTGMYLRLGFAVAAQLEPDILLVDEVLAVGDARFQKKCMAKMQEIVNQGRTIIFVSHNMHAIARLCRRVIYLSKGRVVLDGPANEITETYLSLGLATKAVCEWPDSAEAPGTDIAHLRAVRVRTEEGQYTDRVDIRQPVGIEMELEVLTPDYVLMPYYNFFNGEGVHLFSSGDLDPAWRGRPRPRGRYVSTTWIPGNLLAAGMMSVGVGLLTMNPATRQFYINDTVSFWVQDSTDGDSVRGDWPGKWGGLMRPILKWRTQFSPDGTEVPARSTKETEP